MPIVPWLKSAGVEGSLLSGATRRKGFGNRRIMLMKEHFSGFKISVSNVLLSPSFGLSARSHASLRRPAGFSRSVKTTGLRYGCLVLLRILWLESDHPRWIPGKPGLVFPGGPTVGFAPERFLDWAGMSDSKAFNAADESVWSCSQPGYPLLFPIQEHEQNE